MIKRRAAAFTIVELLVVIVVIGVLAAITIVSYSGLTSRAVDASLKSDLAGAKTKLQLYQVEYGSFPTAMTEIPVGSRTYCPTPADTKYCIKASPGNKFTYSGTATTFTLDNERDGTTIKYRVTESTGPVVASSEPDLFWQQINAKLMHTCGVDSIGSAYCWGNNSDGQIGNNSTDNVLAPTLVSKSGLLSDKTIKSIHPGEYHTCAIASDNQAYCWGWGYGGILGNNSQDSSSIPVAVDRGGVLNGKTIKSMSAGSYHNCVVASDDHAYCWGMNSNYDYSVLGNGSVLDSLVPVAVDRGGVLNGKTIKHISSGRDHTCLVASDSLVYCWGRNDFGQLGNNTNSSSLVPVAVYMNGVLNAKNIKSVHAGNTHTCAVASDNKAYCWGLNSDGQLGNNSTIQNLAPVEIYSSSGALNGKSISTIVVGGWHNCAIDSLGKVYCWGLGVSGQLGNNLSGNSSVPVTVNTDGVLVGKTINSSSTLTAGNTHTCVTSLEGDAYCWGYNGNGQLGNNSNTDSLVPILVNPL